MKRAGRHEKKTDAGLNAARGGCEPFVKIGFDCGDITDAVDGVSARSVLRDPARDAGERRAKLRKFGRARVLPRERGAKNPAGGSGGARAFFNAACSPRV